jgi:septum formation protein
MQVHGSVAEEDLGGDPASVVRHWAAMKADSVSETRPDSPVLGADTMVALEGRLLGKPSSADEAVRTLGLLSGRWHTVWGGVALVWISRGIRFVFAERTEVRFRKLPEAEIRAYVDTGEPMDKAGAYGIQGIGSMLVERVEGCYFNVMGLPVARFVSEFRRAVGEGG